MTRLPTLFVSHGAPDLLLREHPAVDALKRLGARLPEPRAVLVVSAHRISSPITITHDDRLGTVHDFGGFPPALYAMNYPATGDDELSARIAEALAQKGVEHALVSGRGLDHGAWMPLRLIYPDARIPVVQVSLPAGSLEEVARLGEALAPLREQGVLMIGSGTSVHNLRALNLDQQTDPWADEFEAWLRQAVEENHFQWLIDERRHPDSFRYAHPTLEHFAPIVFAWAAAGKDRAGRRIHQSYDYGNLGMSHYAFGEET